MKKKTCRNHGAVLAEAAAVFLIGIPLLITIIFAGVEVTRYFTVRSIMDSCARRAARELVVQYNISGIQPSSVYFITVPGYVAGSDQFDVTWDSANPPAFVTVSCSYPTDGSSGLQPIPVVPLRLQQAISSTFSMPVQ